MSLQQLQSIGDCDAKAQFSELLERVESGEEITITKHGSPVARLVPIGKKSSHAERRAAIDRIIQLSKGLQLGGLAIRDLISEGRR